MSTMKLPANYASISEEEMVYLDGGARDAYNSFLNVGKVFNAIARIFSGASSIINNKHERFIINTMNTGLISNMNQDAVVEVPCYVGAFGIEPTAVGKIPQFHKSLMEMQKGYEKLTVEAALEGSWQKAVEAVMLNRTCLLYTSPSPRDA